MKLSKDMTKDIEDEAEKVYDSFAAREPVVLTGIIGGPILGLVTLFAPDNADQLANQITAAVVTVVVALTGFVVRRWVEPTFGKLVGADDETEDLGDVSEPDTPDSTQGPITATHAQAVAEPPVSAPPDPAAPAPRPAPAPAPPAASAPAEPSPQPPTPPTPYVPDHLAPDDDTPAP